MPSRPIQIDSITVNRDSRQRRELTNIDDLAESMQRLGQIQPIVLDRDGTLVAGERRLAAAQQLGWTAIEAMYRDEVDPVLMRAIELEENVKREALPWNDECLAIKEYHELRRAEDPAWRQDDTSKALGLSERDVSRKIGIATEILAGNQRVIAAPRLSTAAGIIERASARKDEAALGELRKIEAAPKPAEAPPSILNLDFINWAPTYDGPKFNFLHCDFPYGIGAGAFPLGGGAAHGGYEDSEETYWTLCECLANNLTRLTTESAHIVFWFSLHYYQPTLDFFRNNTDIVLDPFPLVWVKSDNVGIVPDPQRGPRRIYETAFFGSRGDRKIVSSIANAYAAPTVRDRHMSEKPEPVLRHFFRMFVDESTILLDPTCGSGSALRAAEGLGAAHVLGLEINSEFAERANIALKSSRAMRRN